MQPHKISFYLYAESSVEAAELERALRKFVSEKRERGVAVTAAAIAAALRAYSDNFFLTQYLKIHAKRQQT